jgi:hypothetical protein
VEPRDESSSCTKLTLRFRPAPTFTQLLSRVATLACAVGMPMTGLRSGRDFQASADAAVTVNFALARKPLMASASERQWPKRDDHGIPPPLAGDRLRRFAAFSLQWPCRLPMPDKPRIWRDRYDLCRR